MGRGSGGTDSLKRRDRNEDSVTVRFRYLDSTKYGSLDTTINDFTRRFPLPSTHIVLGNTGTAAKSLLFSPLLTAGWDPGLHALDIYKWKLEEVKFFSTTRPYSELAYQLASKSEQLIELMHTQNIKPNWNFLLKYRLINAPGFFNNQKTNHNNYLATSMYETINRRYRNYFVLLGNRLQSGENGGIRTDDDYLNSPDFNDRFLIPTRIGGDPDFTRNFFNTDVGTGNRYYEFNVLFRQQFDLGRKDSLVTDSTVIPLFYPRLRFEHTFTFGKYRYEFRDFLGDSTYYKDNFGLQLDTPTDTVLVRDQWREYINDFSIYQFPDAKNLQQFFKVGAAIQNLQLLSPSKRNYYNVYGHAEYRNKTRNQKWDILASGKLYFVGLNFGDYSAYASLQRATAGKVPGYVLLGAENVNRTPSFIFNDRSDFIRVTQAKDFKNENSTHLFASLSLPPLKLKLSGDYFLVTNYSYIRNYDEGQQFKSLFNVLRVTVEKTFKLGKRFYWHSENYFQQAVGNAPVNLPQWYTRNRIGYEGKFGLRNLQIALGLEGRYHTPYTADGYAPVSGQFFVQDSIRINNRPDIAAYLHFKIRSFKAYVRVENLNAAEFSNGNLQFTHNNIEVPGYPYPGMLFRLGIYWSFVN